MNKTSIEWTDETWNPISGCFHPCRNIYCYNTMKNSAWLNRFGTRYFNKRGQLVHGKNWRKRETGENHIAKKGEVYPYGFDPTLYPHRLDEPLRRFKKPCKVFTVDVGDLFGHWVPQEWILKVLEVIQKCPQHTFQLLTKNPKRLLDFKFPENVWAGTSVNSNSDKKRVEILKKVKAPVRFLSIEPLLGSLSEIDFNGLQWLIIGAQTGKKAPGPDPLWVEDILKRAYLDNDIPLFLKENIKPYFQCDMQDYPTL